MANRRAKKTSNDKSFVITVRAKPRSAVSSLEAAASGVWIARLRSAPIDGKANAELIGLVAKHFGCSKSSVAVVSGAAARLKLVKISGAAAVQHHELRR
jgi:uncharacterized protein YggU (UPF0235/DUF167 family)